MKEIKHNPLFDGKKPLLMAHRGYTVVAPENTLASFEAAARLGYWAIETDIHKTLDGALVCCHNSSLKKMYGVDMKIEECTLKELSECRVSEGNNVDMISSGKLRLPLFTEYLDICKASGCVPFIESKGSVVGDILKTVDSYGMIDGVVMSSIDFSHIEEARRVSKRVFIHHIFSTTELMERVAELGNGGVSYNYPNLDELPDGLIELTHNCGVRLCLRAGDTPEAVKRMLSLGLDYIPTNKMTPDDCRE